MNKPFLIILMVSILSGVPITSVFADISHDMGVLSTNLIIIKKSDNVIDIKAALTKMRAASESAKTQTPPKLQNKSADSPEMRDYRHGYDILIEKIDSSLKLLDMGKTAEAKAIAADLLAIRNDWHKKYR